MNTLKSDKFHCGNLAIVLLVGLSVLLGAQNHVQADNPLDWPVAISYKRDGNIYHTTQMFYGLYQDPAEANYDGCKTEENNEFEHGHFPHGFPFTDTKDGRNWDANAAMCDAFWQDGDYSGYSQESGATCVKNCHGYATGRSWLVGMATVIADEWKDISDPVDNCISYVTSHSIVITDACPGCECICGEPECAWKVIKTTYEKMGTSGVYSITYPCPYGDGGGSNLYDEDDD